MRSSRWAPVAGWFAATASSIVLSWVALLPVLNAARPDVGTLPDIDQVPAADVVAPVPVPVPLPSSASRPAPSRSVTTPAQPTTPTAKPSKPSPKPSSAKASTEPAATTVDGWTVTTGGDGLRTYLKSFTVKGGRAVIKMTSDGVVSLVTATPADGFAVQRTQSAPTDMAVYFNETNHSFIIHAIWWNDAPFVEVSEIGS